MRGLQAAKARALLLAALTLLGLSACGGPDGSDGGTGVTSEPSSSALCDKGQDFADMDHQIILLANESVEEHPLWRENWQDSVKELARRLPRGDVKDAAKELGEVSPLIEDQPWSEGQRAAYATLGNYLQEECGIPDVQARADDLSPALPAAVCRAGSPFVDEDRMATNDGRADVDAVTVSSWHRALAELARTLPSGELKDAAETLQQVTPPMWGEQWGDQEVAAYTLLGTQLESGCGFYGIGRRVDVLNAALSSPERGSLCPLAWAFADSDQSTMLRLANAYSRQVVAEPRWRTNVGELARVLPQGEIRDAAETLRAASTVVSEDPWPEDHKRAFAVLADYLQQECELELPRSSDSWYR